MEMFAHLLHFLASLHLHYSFSECVLFSMNSSPKTTPLLTPLSEDSGTVLHCSTSYTFHWSTVHTTDVNIRNISVHFEFCSIRHGYSKHITSSVSLEMCKRHVTNTIFLHTRAHTHRSITPFYYRKNLKPCWIKSDKRLHKAART